MSENEITSSIASEALVGTFPGDLGIEVLEIGPDGVRGRLVVDRRHLHPGGYVHGGVWVAFADTVAAWGTVYHLPQGAGFTTIELKTNVFSPALPGHILTATAVPLHLGKRTHVWEVRVERDERLAANFICTQMVL